MKLRPTWWCDKNDDGAPVVRMSCKVPGFGEWRSQYVLRLRPSYTLSVFVAVQILNHELAFMFGPGEELTLPDGLRGGAQ